MTTTTTTRRRPLAKEAAASKISPWVVQIDDDESFCTALRLRLGAQSIRVESAMRGAEGIDLATSRRPSAVLLDVNMPDTSGAIVLQTLKQCELTQDVPVVVISGLRDPRVKQEMLARGAAEFLNKPLDFDRLMSVLASYINVEEQARTSQDEITSQRIQRMFEQLNQRLDAAQQNLQQHTDLFNGS